MLRHEGKRLNIDEDKRATMILHEAKTIKKVGGSTKFGGKF